MFNLFRKKVPAIRIIDKVWMNEASKRKALIEEWKKNKNVVFVFWFDETLQTFEIELAKQTTEAAKLFTAREVSSVHIENNPLIFAEHYPLTEKENTLFQKLGLKEATVWSALDEPLFQLFGGERIIELMKKLGMNEEEAIEHSMISKSIGNAQEKIASKVNIEQSARSQKDWFQKNMPT
jgi:hypothetical protein